jgi:hypothetical protein
MGQLTDVVKNSLLNHLYGNSAYTPPSNFYIGLFNGQPSSGGTEVSYTGYIRQEVTFGTPSNRSIKNNNQMVFPESDGVATATYAGIYSASTGGTLIGESLLTSQLNIVSGNEPVIPIDAISITINTTAVGAGMTDYTANSLLALLFNNTAFTAPDMYFSSSSTVISDSGTGFTEQTGTGYARTLFSSFSIATAKEITNTTDITLYTPTANDQDIIVAMAVFDASTGGNMLMFDNDNVVDQTPVSGDIIKIKSGQFKHRLL